MNIEIFICKICGQELTSRKDLVKHNWFKHRINAEQTVLEYFYNGIKPKCACGCETELKYLSAFGDYGKYVKGHISRIVNNYNTEKSKANSKKTKGERAESGIYKGIPKSKEHKDKIREKSLLHRHSDESKDKISKAKLEYIKNNPEKANYYNNIFWKEYWKDPKHKEEQGFRLSFLDEENYKLKLQLKNKTSQESYVYLIGVENRNCYKIGYTNRTPLDRLINLQQSTPDKLILIDWFKTKNNTRLEKCLHEKFKETRITKEWFKLTEEEIFNFKKTCEKFEEVLS